MAQSTQHHSTHKQQKLSKIFKMGNLQFSMFANNYLGLSSGSVLSVVLPREGDRMNDIISMILMREMAHWTPVVDKVDTLDW